MSRIPKKDDQQNTQKAYELLMNLIERHQKEIEPALWIGGMICALSDNFQKSNICFNDFKEDLIEAINHYKY